MRFQHIRFQKGNLAEDFKSHYKQLFIENSENNNLKNNAQQIYKLMTYLENIEKEIIYYACISHESIILFDKDYSFEESSNAQIQISISSSGEFYNITQKLNSGCDPWQYISGSTNNLETAKEMILKKVVGVTSAT